jgi:hypothetical protein
MKPESVDPESYEQECLKLVKEWPGAFQNPSHWPGRSFVGVELHGKHPETELWVTLYDARYQRDRTFRYQIWELNRKARDTDELYDPEVFVSLVFMWAMEE